MKEFLEKHSEMVSWLPPVSG